MGGWSAGPDASLGPTAARGGPRPRGRRRRHDVVDPAPGPPRDDGAAGRAGRPRPAPARGRRATPRSTRRRPPRPRRPGPRPRRRSRGPSCKGRPTAAPIQPPAARRSAVGALSLGSPRPARPARSTARSPSAAPSRCAIGSGRRRPAMIRTPAPTHSGGQDEPGPADDGAQRLVDPGAHRTGGGTVEGQGQQEPDGDQADRPQVGAVVAEEARRRLLLPAGRTASTHRPVARFERDAAAPLDFGADRAGERLAAGRRLVVTTVPRRLPPGATPGDAPPGRPGPRGGRAGTGPARPSRARD